MAKKALLIVFAIECVALAVLLCREWTLYYIGGGHAETEYQGVYRDKIDAGHHPVTADIDAGTTSFVVPRVAMTCGILPSATRVTCPRIARNVRPFSS